MTSIIFTHSIAGHNMEYLHHIYEICRFKLSQKYVFVVPIEFEDIKSKMVWPAADNVTFDFISETEKATYANSGVLLQSFHLCKILNRRIRKYDANRVFVITLMTLLPFAPFIIRSGVTINGIIYKIYLHLWKSISAVKKIEYVIQYVFLSYSRIFKKIYILNDSASVGTLNKLYRTSKFQFLPDPYIPMPSDKLTDIRAECNLSEDHRLFIHIGAMSVRKGTIAILDSLKYLTNEEKSKYVFLFAGKVLPDVFDEFYERVRLLLQTGCNIIVKDEFCSYEYFSSLCNACDCILIPYFETAQSSGIIGYAAQFGRPVIASKYGLLGKLVRKYHLGLTTDCTSRNLTNLYQRIENWNGQGATRKYCIDNSLQAFQETIGAII